MLNIISDGPFRYVHSAATGELIVTLLQEANGRFTEYYNGRICRTLREWKAIARKRLGDQLITDTDGRN